MFSAFFCGRTAAAKKCFVFGGYGDDCLVHFFAAAPAATKKWLKKNGTAAVGAAAETPKPWPGGGLKKTDDFEVDLGAAVSKNSLV